MDKFDAERLKIMGNGTWQYWKYEDFGCDECGGLTTPCGYEDGFSPLLAGAKPIIILKFICPDCGAEWTEHRAIVPENTPDLDVEEILREMADKGILVDSLTDEDIDVILSNAPEIPVSETLKARALAAMQSARPSKSQRKPNENSD